jgi:hypothetical protein
MSGIDAIPNVNMRKAGKNTEDPVKNLPQFGEKRVKQKFIESYNRLDVQINPNVNPVGQESFDLIKEINASNKKKTLILLCFFFIN